MAEELEEIEPHLWVVSGRGEMDGKLLVGASSGSPAEATAAAALRRPWAVGKGSMSFTALWGRSLRG